MFLKRVVLALTVLTTVFSACTLHAYATIPADTQHLHYWHPGDPVLPPHAAFTADYIAAHPKQFIKPHTAGFSTLVSSTTGLQYHQGSVDTAGTAAFNIYWEPSAPSTYATYNGYLGTFFNDIGNTGYYGNLTQYYDNQGLHIYNSSYLGGTWQDTQAYPSSKIRQSDLQAEVIRAFNNNPGWQQTSDSQYTIFLGSGEDLCFQDGTTCFNSGAFCAYHASFVYNGLYFAYAAVPFGIGPDHCRAQSCPNGTNGGCNIDTALTWLSHETMETTTDPYGGGWWDPNVASNVNEIGDKCQTLPYSGMTLTAPNGQLANHRWVNGSGTYYALQDEWDNAYTSGNGGTGGACAPYGPKYP